MRREYAEDNNLVNQSQIESLIKSDLKNSLLEAWIEKREDFESKLRSAIQDVEYVKRKNPMLTRSIAYRAGKVDGFVELFEKFYQTERNLERIKKCRSLRSAVGKKIVYALSRNHKMTLTDVCEDVGVSFDRTVEITQDFLKCGVARALLAGENTKYYLSEECKYFLKHNHLE